MASPSKSNSFGDAAPSSSQTASLLLRLAGPSTGKAGLSKDQTEINRIIAEASKGSKYYENEKRKDKELTEKIEKILKQRDDALRGADIAAVERGVDKLLAELEAQRDLSQVIVHVDMDAFFANVEMLDDPKLKGKAFGVGLGVLTTASYEARKFGVRSGMATFIARKLCPELILVPIHSERYSEMSRRVMAVFREYDPNMDVVGCDEGYLNITSYCAEHDLDPDECVHQMRKQVHEETGLTASAGIAPNKMLAKICSDKNKPNGQFHLPFTRADILAFTHALPLRRIPGVGRVAERLLAAVGVHTCGDVHAHRATLALLERHYDLPWLLQTHLGLASNVVEPGRREERKSIGAERTFNPLSNKERIVGKLEEVARELEEDMERGGWAGKTVTLKYKRADYQVFTRARTMDRWVTKREELFAIGKELLAHEGPLELRLIGLRVTKLKDLRAEAEDTEGGIKRFLKPTSSGPPSPRKRRKTSDDLARDVDAESPVGEHELAAAQQIPTADEQASATNDGVGLTCPICGRTLETDNEGLNAHVDWCLSRGVILAATGKDERPKEKLKGEKAKAAWGQLFGGPSGKPRYNAGKQ